MILTTKRKIVLAAIAYQTLAAADFSLARTINVIARPGPRNGLSRKGT